MSLKHSTPCDWMKCPYDAQNMADCEFYCGADEPQDDPEVWEKNEADKERKAIWLIIEDAIENIYNMEPSFINGDKIIEDLCHIQTCIDKTVYDIEEN